MNSVGKHATLYAWSLLVFAGAAAWVIWHGVSRAAQAEVQISAEVIAPATPVAGSGSSSGSSSGGGGGGGGGGYDDRIDTTVSLSGRAYPLSRVTVLKDGQKAISTIAGPDSLFNVTLTGLSSGNYVFSVYSEDKNNRRSTPFTFPVFVAKGAATKVSGIFIAPTIALDKTDVPHGETVDIFGQSIPKGEVTIAVNSESELFLKTTADKDGVYLAHLDTAPLEIGAHTAKSKTALKEEISPFSQSLDFQVSAPSIPAASLTETPSPEPSSEPPLSVSARQVDVNTDGAVNLVDFSVMAYWYKRPEPPPSMDFNADGAVDLIDFSIMAFHWSG